MSYTNAYVVVLDSRQYIFDRITTELRAGSYRLHSDASNFKWAPGLGVAVDQLLMWPTETLFVYSLDCDETKLVETLKNMPPSKLPTSVVVYGAYPNLSAKFSYALTVAFGNAMLVSVIPGDI